VSAAVADIADKLEPRIRFTRSEGELDTLTKEIQIGFEAGYLSQVQADRLTWLVDVHSPTTKSWPGQRTSIGVSEG
jgi:hypothetical protein